MSPPRVIPSSTYPASWGQLVHQPGTYRGGQIEGTFGGLYLTYAIADEYKAPWFKNTAGFSKSNPYASDPFSDENKIDHPRSGRATPSENGTAITGAFGQSEGHGQLPLQAGPQVRRYWVA